MVFMISKTRISVVRSSPMRPRGIPVALFPRSDVRMAGAWLTLGMTTGTSLTS